MSISTLSLTRTIKQPVFAAVLFLGQHETAFKAHLTFIMRVEQNMNLGENLFFPSEIDVKVKA